MADTHETHAEITAEMRFHGQQNIDAEKDKPEYGILTMEGRIALNYADRLDAAHKREVDVLKQRCAELNAEVVAKDEVIQRLDAEVRKNQEEREIRIAAQKAKAAAEGYADGKRDAQVGDAAKLREAVLALKELDFNKEEDCYDFYRIIDAALAAPQRNCDRPECKDIQSAMNVYRRECCEDGPLYARKEGAMHEAEWLLAPATEKEGGAK